MTAKLVVSARRSSTLLLGRPREHLTLPLQLRRLLPLVERLDDEALERRLFAQHDSHVQQGSRDVKLLVFLLVGLGRRGLDSSSQNHHHSLFKVSPLFIIHPIFRFHPNFINHVTVPAGPGGLGAADRDVIGGIS